MPIAEDRFQYKETVKYVWQSRYVIHPIRYDVISETGFDWSPRDMVFYTRRVVSRRMTERESAAGPWSRLGHGLGWAMV